MSKPAGSAARFPAASTTTAPARRFRLASRPLPQILGQGLHPAELCPHAPKVVGCGLLEKAGRSMATTRAYAPPYESTAGAAWIVVGMLGAMAMLQAVSLGPLAHKYLILQRLRDDSSYSVPEMQLSDAISQAVTYLTAGFFLTTVSCFLIWQYRCVRNLPALGIADRRLSPRWSVGGWFVPIVNLVHGYRVMS